MRDEIIDEISVCADCMFVHANGESDLDRDPTKLESWALIGFGFNVTMGGEHAEDCPNRDAVSSEVDCDCENLGFRWQSCEGCGSNLDGDRYKFTLWRATDATARDDFRKAIQSARTARANGGRTAARESLARAAQWRQYLTDRFAERNRFARWEASVRLVGTSGNGLAS